MRRRTFLRLMGIVAITPHSASTQSTKRTYRVGLFNRGTPITDTSGYGKALICGLEKRDTYSAAISSSSGAAQAVASIFFPTSWPSL